MRYTSILLMLDKISYDDTLAVIIIRLMMACNDISLSNACLADYEDRLPENKSMNIAACMYFIRLQIGHIEEGLKIIDEIRKKPSLLQRIDRLSQNSKDCFEKLCSCLDGKDKKWRKYFTPIRQNLSFHYNERKQSKLIRQALKERIEKKKQEMSRITVGDIKHTRFALGDEIVDTIVCRKIFDIPYTVDFEKDRTKLDEILNYGSRIGKSFLSFGAEFIYKIAES